MGSGADGAAGTTAPARGAMSGKATAAVPDATGATAADDGAGGAGNTTARSDRAIGSMNVGGGIAVRFPASWRLLAPRMTSLSYPAERLLLTSYPAQAGGNCAPDRAVRALPAGGALIYLYEYRPARGAVWRTLKRRDFQRRPQHFTLRARDLGTYECWRVPTYSIRFRAADRPFELHVALGPRATAQRRAQVLRILDSLRFAELPPPPPDPYAGWRLLIDETGDSLRTPPGWPAAPTTSPRRYSRPRSLFFASNVRLPGLAPAPARSERAPRRLPAPFPAAALDGLPDAGVLLWFLEEAKGGPSADFPAIHRSWPTAQDFRLAQDGPASRWPRLRWERAGIAARGGHRFSLWVISGPAASDADRALAHKSAAALAFSTGPYRDARCRRACKTG